MKPFVDHFTHLALVWGKDAHIFKPERFIDTEDYKWPRDGCES